MLVTASQLRADIYNLLDHVIATGEPLEILRNGTRVRIVTERSSHWLDHPVDRRQLHPQGVDGLGAGEDIQANREEPQPPEAGRSP